ncbi:helix-turn-helix domain-containing protein [Kitasatospora cineracea]|nr:helix-turn-helix domain-containing protein [Kitasatospora cineracea]
MDRDYAEPLDVTALAKVALMSVGHFQRSFRAAYGETPYSYLMTRRIERAKTLLRRGDLSVTEVCMAVGCTSLGSFSTRFTELVGESPSTYRARDHSAAEHITACVAMYLTRPIRGTDTGRPRQQEPGPESQPGPGPESQPGPEPETQPVRNGEARAAADR